MAIIDNTLAAQVPTFDPATPLAKMAQIQAANQEIQQAQFKQNQLEMGSEMRGLQPFVNTPEFPAKWREVADRLRSRGVINDQMHQQWANAPSPLLMKSIISQTEDPALSFRREEAARDQQNQNRNFSLAQQRINLASDKTPAGFQKQPDGTYAPLPGGPQDPAYLARVSQAEGKKNLPAGFEQGEDGGLRPIKGGPADPAYLRQKGDRQNAPSGYVWVDPDDTSKGLRAIPGGPGEKVDAEVAARLGLAKSFLGQLDDYTDVEGNTQKGLRARIKAGEATGAFDGPVGSMNLGESGSIRRKISSGAEALLRNLTGAGMNIDEAKKYVARYEPQWNDSAKTLLDKVNQLERELRSVDEVVSKGRGGSVLGAKDTGRPKQIGSKKDYDALPAGSRFIDPEGNERVKP